MKKNKFNIIIYIALVLISYEQFNIVNYNGWLRGKNISIVFFLLYFVLSIKDIINMKFNKIEKMIALLYIIQIFISIVEGFKTNEFHNVIFYLNGNIVPIIIYLDLKKFYIYSSKEQVTKSMKVMFYSSCIIGIVSGVLQIIYIYIYKFSLISNLFVFLFGDLRYIQSGRLHFILSEPSATGQWAVMIVLFSYLYLINQKNIKYHKINNVMIAIIAIMCLFTLSIRTYLDIFAFVLIYAFYTFKKNIKKVLIRTMYVSITLLTFIVLMNNSVFNISNNNFARIKNVLSGSKQIKDSSQEVRTVLLKSGLEGFIQKPFIGWGCGNYSKAYKNNYSKYVNDVLFETRAELDLNYNLKYAYSHSFYATTLCESGIIGFIFIICVLTLILDNRKYRYMGLFAIYTLIQSEIVGNTYIIIVIAYLCSQHFKEKLDKQTMIANNIKK